MPKEVKRNFEVSDIEMLEANKVMREFFILDKAEFVAFDPDFADPYAANWSTTIQDAEAEPDDETVVDIIVQKTNAVEDKLAVCRHKYQSSKFFIEKAFPANQAVWNEFGYNDYDSVRKSQPAMVAFMKKFNAVANKYNTELIAAGYSQANIDEILTFANTLDTANLSQEVEKGSRFTATQSRITKMNAAWAIMVYTGKAGKTIYADNFAKYQRYLLPASDESGQNLNIRGTVTNTAGGAPIQGVGVNIISLGIDTLTNSQGKFVFGGLEVGNYTITFHKDGFLDTSLDVAIEDGVLLEPNVQMTAV